MLTPVSPPSLEQKPWHENVLTSGQTTTIILFLCLSLSLCGGGNHLALSGPAPSVHSQRHRSFTALQRKRQRTGWRSCRACARTYALCTCMHWSSVSLFSLLHTLRVQPTRSRKPESWSRLEPGKGRGCGWTPRPRSKAQQELSESASGHWDVKHCGAKSKLLWD